jgi:hypothetical protein
MFNATLVGRKSLCCFVFALTSVTSFAVGDYETRVAFAQNLTVLKKAFATRKQTLQLLGEPFRKEYRQYGDPSKEEVRELWLYARKPNATFPTLGTVMFGSDGRVFKVFGDRKPSGNLCDVTGDVDAWMELIASTPGLYQKTFQSKKVVDICAKLIRLPFKDAMSLLSEYARVKPKLEPQGDGSEIVTSQRWDGNDGQIGILLLTLFAGDREMGRDVFPHVASIKSQTDPKDKTYLGEVVVWSGWPIVTPTGHVPTSGWSYEESLMSVALKRKRFTYCPPPGMTPTETDFRLFCLQVVAKLPPNSPESEFKQIFASQLGIKQ